MRARSVHQARPRRRDRDSEQSIYPIRLPRRCLQRHDPLTGKLRGHAPRQAQGHYVSLLEKGLLDRRVAQRAAPTKDYKR